jgi:tyrosyl-tRNA synthetase
MKAGVEPTIFLADYHAWINGKLGGDLEKIQQVAQGYFKSAFISLGLEEGKVKYVLGSQIYDNDYWKEVVKISKDTTISRMLRCTTIMGRAQKDALDCGSILYPAMQVADIFLLDVDIAHAGMDQRKVHMLAREAAEKYKRKKPIALHHSLLMGLAGPQRAGIEQNEKDDLIVSSKMSKSKPDSCIFIHDLPQEIKRKVDGAYCPAKVVENNPVLEMCKYLVFRSSKTFKVERPAKFGGDVEFCSFGELESAYKDGRLHPQDLKAALASWLADALEPSRKYFESKQELLLQL